MEDSDAKIGQAIKLTEAKKDREAANLFLKVLEENPDLPDECKEDIIRKAGRCLENLHDINGILRLLYRYRNIFPPESIHSYYMREVMAYYLMIIGNYKRSIEIAEKIYEKLRPTNELKVFSRAQITLGCSYIYTGNVEKAIDLLQSAYHTSLRISDYSRLPAVLTALSDAYKIFARWDLAKKYLRMALRSAIKLDSEQWKLFAMLNLVSGYTHMGNWEAAEKLANRVITLFPQGENTRVSLEIKRSIAVIYIRKRQFKKAENILKIDPESLKKIRIPRTKCFYFHTLGVLHYEQGNYEKALHYNLKAHSIVMKIAPESDDAAEIHVELAKCYISLNRLESAQSHLDEALRLSVNLKNKFREAQCYRNYARLLLAKGEKEAASKYYEMASSILEEIAETYERGCTLLEYGNLLSETGNHYKAVRLLSKAEELFRKLPSKYWVAQAHFTISQVCYRSRDFDMALKHLKTAKNLFEELGEKKLLQKADALREKIEEEMVNFALLRSKDYVFPDQDIEGMLNYLREKIDLNAVILSIRTNGNFRILCELNIHSPISDFVLNLLNRQKLKEPLLIADLEKSRKFSTLRRKGIKSILFFPFNYSDEQAVLYVDKKDILKQKDLILTARFTRHLAGKLSELRHSELKEENLLLIKELRKREYPDIITKNLRMLEILDLVDKIKDERTPVLIEGETGTGKELIARAIHFRGKRSSNPFVTVDCGALPEGLAESLLFGHKKGAFTGAISDNPGFFEEANRGTLFLDEINNLSPGIQAKLLRVLQDGTVRRLGEHGARKVDVRIIAASNVDLEEAVRDGDFRKDLFYRLKGIRIKIPPLRERKEDIPLLVQYFVSKYSKARQKKVKKITREAMNALMSHDWDGNVRELEKEIERAIILMDNGLITPDLFSFVDIKNRKSPLTVDDILEALKKNNWVIRKTARYLGISESALRKRLKTNGIQLAVRA